MWIFGYGSLIWNPGFEFESSVVGTLSNYHRSFCIRSIQARGTLERPGLGLALTACPGATCQGVAFCVTPRVAAKVLEYLRARELSSSVYDEQTVPLALIDGRRVEAVTYVANTAHPEFVTGLSPDDQARLIAGASGQRGPNSEYLLNTSNHLAALGIDDPELTALARRVVTLIATPTPG